MAGALPNGIELKRSPLVSVVIPTYNHRAFVLDTLASVFRQRFTDYEIVVVNDGSPDDTAELLRPLVSSGRIRYIDQANAGQAAARNRGITEARGTFVALLDDDDLWPPDKLEWQVAALVASPHSVLVYGAMRGLDARSEAPERDAGLPTASDRSLPPEDAYRLFLTGNWITSPGQTLICRKALLGVGGFDSTIWGVDDWDLYIRLARTGHFVASERVALWYRVHAGNASADAERMATNMLTVQRRHVGRLPRPGYMREWLSSTRATHGYLASLFCREALDHMSRGDHGRALRSWWSGLCLQPGFLRHARLRRSLITCLMLALTKPRDAVS
jgi:glycosyltransferase involved in cell wall biosynthesis